MAKPFGLTSAFRLTLVGLRNPQGAIAFLFFGVIAGVCFYLLVQEGLSGCGKFGRYFKYYACHSTDPVGYDMGMLFTLVGALASLAMALLGPMAIGHQASKEQV